VSLEPRGASTDVAAWAGIRTILVPPDIVAVPRRSPALVRKRTPWRPREGCDSATERPGAREWFSDHLFVETQHGHDRAGYGTSIIVHVGCAIVLMLVLLTRHVPTVRVDGRSSMIMPATLSFMPVADAPSLVVRSVKPVERTAPEPAARPSAGPDRPASAVSPAPPPPTAAVSPAQLAPAAGVSAAAPIDPPSSITPETGGEIGTEPPGGIAGGISGGVAGGMLGGTGAKEVASRGPLRPGGRIQRPEKVKHVNPVYPHRGLSHQTQGIVVIEATIDVDGKVAEARVLRSSAALDQAALDAVRQWEYAPSLLNGVPVQVIMTIVINFTIQ
jgi:periplasmic protein TonB